jgi:hypothetical protein
LRGRIVEKQRDRQRRERCPHGDRW